VTDPAEPTPPPDARPEIGPDHPTRPPTAPRRSSTSPPPRRPSARPRASGPTRAPAVPPFRPRLGDDHRRCGPPPPPASPPPPSPAHAPTEHPGWTPSRSHRPRGGRPRWLPKPLRRRAQPDGAAVRPGAGRRSGGRRPGPPVVPAAPFAPPVPPQPSPLRPPSPSPPPPAPPQRGGGPADHGRQSHRCQGDPTRTMSLHPVKLAVRSASSARRWRPVTWPCYCDAG